MRTYFLFLLAGLFTPFLFSGCSSTEPKSKHFYFSNGTPLSDAILIDFVSQEWDQLDSLHDLSEATQIHTSLLARPQLFLDSLIPEMEGSWEQSLEFKEVKPDSKESQKHVFRTAVLVAEGNSGRICVLRPPPDFPEAILRPSQLGSASWLFRYAIAFSQGLGPDSYYPNGNKNEPIQIGDWTPENASESPGFTFREIFNGASPQIIHGNPYRDISQTQIDSILNLLGIPPQTTTADFNWEASLWELTGAMTAIREDGSRKSLTLIDSITDKNGRTIFSRSTGSQQVFTPAHFQKMDTVLKDYAEKRFPLLDSVVAKDIRGHWGNTANFREVNLLANHEAFSIGISSQLIHPKYRCRKMARCKADVRLSLLLNGLLHELAKGQESNLPETD